MLNIACGETAVKTRDGGQKRVHTMDDYIINQSHKTDNLNKLPKSRRQIPISLHSCIECFTVAEIEFSPAIYFLPITFHSSFICAEDWEFQGLNTSHFVKE
jgi:hypothetical protein